jgi:hypothetical protein
MDQMDQPHAHGRSPDPLTAALEAGCGGLLALGIARREMADSDADLDVAMEEVNNAIVSLRGAIDRLRAAQAEHAEVLALGFVLGAKRMN